MRTEKMREEFEEWASKEKFSLALNWNGKYRTPATRWTWDAWQASRAAIEVELPDPRKTLAGPSLYAQFKESV